MKPKMSHNNPPKQKYLATIVAVEICLHTLWSWGSFGRVQHNVFGEKVMTIHALIAFSCLIILVS